MGQLSLGFDQALRWRANWLVTAASGSAPLFAFGRCTGLVWVQGAIARHYHHPSRSLFPAYYCVVICPRVGLWDGMGGWVDGCVDGCVDVSDMTWNMTWHLRLSVSVCLSGSHVPAFSYLTYLCLL